MHEINCGSVLYLPRLGLCSEVRELALLHAGLQPFSLSCQCSLLLKSTVPLGIPLSLHTEDAL